MNEKLNIEMFTQMFLSHSLLVLHHSTPAAHFNSTCGVNINACREHLHQSVTCAACVNHKIICFKYTMLFQSTRPVVLCVINTNGGGLNGAFLLLIFFNLLLIISSEKIRLELWPLTPSLYTYLKQ